MKRKQGNGRLPFNTTEQSDLDNNSNQRNRIRARAAATYLAPRIPKAPTDINVIVACRQQAPYIVQRLLELTQSKHGPTAVKACEIVLNRAYGRAPLTVNITHAIIEDRAELERAARVILAKRARLRRGQVIDANIDANEDNEDNEDRGGRDAMTGVGGEKRVPLENALTTPKISSAPTPAVAPPLFADSILRAAVEYSESDDINDDDSIDDV